ncbi:hypothetical protein Lbir_1655 [Legionella birminghamensis]|uniref:Uncharacterized protein n=1 Tax=Legionella birminghamensis TaxID=28083 RepID=A0A378I6U7_9GAMM|nr:hypothetical protein Lbir_1655 [Legionella birminghamensis]STX30889.1 Uncharacterised protein [Legionella birminghamensis]
MTGPRGRSQLVSTQIFFHSESPRRSPFESPLRSPFESPRRSPFESPLRGPFESPRLRPRGPMNLIQSPNLLNSSFNRYSGRIVVF